MTNPRALLPLAVALVLSTATAAVAWVSIKGRSTATIDVTGSAKRRIVSDLIEWEVSLSTERADRVEAYKQLKADVEQTLTYLKARGVKDDELRVASTAMDERFETEFQGSGDDRIERTVSKGWRASTSILVRSENVPPVEKLSRETTDLLEKGVSIVSHEPAYLYTKLSELKVEMLAEASKDARTRAERIIDSAGGGASLGAIKNVDMGVINVNPANSTETSWQGNNDTSALEKDIITIVHMTYAIGD